MKIGARIRWFREQQHMSQEALAEKMNVSRQAVTKWESDKSLPSTANLLELCNIFGTSFDELTGSSQVDQADSLPTRPAGSSKKRYTIWILAAVNLLMLVASGLVYRIDHADSVPMDAIGYAQGPTDIMVIGTPGYCYLLYGATLIMTAVTIAFVAKTIFKRKVRK